MDYSLQIASNHVDRYRRRDEKLMVEHRQAMECRDCEEFLQSGIEAFNWLAHADMTMREASVLGLEVPQDTVSALETLYRVWLLPCAHAEEMIAKQRERGYEPSNIQEFRDACHKGRRAVAKLDALEILEQTHASAGVFDSAFWKGAAELPNQT